MVKIDYNSNYQSKYKYVYVEYEDIEYADKMYCYLDNNKNVKRGDRVLVNRAGDTVTAKVINVVSYTLDEVPFPLEYMKDILKVIDKDFKLEDYYEYEEEPYSPYDTFSKKISVFEDIENKILEDGTLSNNFDLRNYLIDSDKNFTPGMIDIVMKPEKNKEFIDFFIKLLSLLKEDTVPLNGNLTDKYLYENKNIRMLGNLEDISNYIITNKEKINIKDLYNYSIYLILCCKNPESVKLGIGILLLMPISKEDKIIEALEKISLCEEFTLYTNYIFDELPNKNNIRFRLAQKISGWGKVIIVESLEVTNNKIKEWLITNGVENDISYSVLAYPLTIKINIIEVLNKENISIKELNGISKIINGLLDNSEGLEGITLYSEKDELFKIYLNLHIKFNNRTYYNLTLLNILEYTSKIKDYSSLTNEITNYFKSKKLLNNIKNIITKKLDNEEDINDFNNACLILNRIDNNELNSLIYKSLEENKILSLNAIEILLKDNMYTEKIISFISNYDFKKYYEESLEGGSLDNHLYNILSIMELIDEYPLICEKIIIDGYSCNNKEIKRGIISLLDEWLYITNRTYNDLSENLKKLLNKIKLRKEDQVCVQKINMILYGTDEIIPDPKEESLFNIFDDDLKEYFSDEVINEGIKCYKENMVYDCKKVNDSYVAHVQSNNIYDDYEVDINCEKNNVMYINCNCPSSECCKHMYATILYIKDNYK